MYNGFDIWAADPSGSDVSTNLERFNLAFLRKISLRVSSSYESLITSRLLSEVCLLLWFPRFVQLSRKSAISKLLKRQGCTSLRGSWFRQGTDSSLCHNSNKIKKALAAEGADFELSQIVGRPNWL